MIGITTLSRVGTDAITFTKGKVPNIKNAGKMLFKLAATEAGSLLIKDVWEEAKYKYRVNEYKREINNAKCDEEKQIWCDALRTCVGKKQTIL